MGRKKKRKQEWTVGEKVWIWGMREALITGEAAEEGDQFWNVYRATVDS
jgi:hypothetical protein